MYIASEPISHQYMWSDKGMLFCLTTCILASLSFACWQIAQQSLLFQCDMSWSVCMLIKCMAVSVQCLFAIIKVLEIFSFGQNMCVRSK